MIHIAYLYIIMNIPVQEQRERDGPVFQLFVMYVASLSCLPLPC